MRPQNYQNCMDVMWKQ